MDDEFRFDAQFTPRQQQKNENFIFDDPIFQFEDQNDEFYLSNHNQPFDHEKYNQFQEKASDINEMSSTNENSVKMMNNNENSQKSEEDDPQSDKQSNVPKVTKGISKKQYEPLIDQNVIYRYEDNPTEYKKARKRLQNRESATRVRSKKKNYTEQLEAEIHELKQKNSELLLTNAKLQAENNLMKQQNQFYEKIISNPNINNGPPMNIQNYQQIFQDIKQANIQEQNKIFNYLPDNQPQNYETEPSINPPFSRIHPEKSERKQLFLIALATILFCVTILSGFDNNVVGYDQLINAVQRNQQVTQQIQIEGSICEY